MWVFLTKLWCIWRHVGRLQCPNSREAMRSPSYNFFTSTCSYCYVDFWQYLCGENTRAKSLPNSVLSSPRVEQYAGIILGLCSPMEEEDQKVEMLCMENYCYLDYYTYITLSLFMSIISHFLTVLTGRPLCCWPHTPIWVGTLNTDDITELQGSSWRSCVGVL